MQLAIERVSKHYRRKAWALREFSLEWVREWSVCLVQTGRASPR